MDIVTIMTISGLLLSAVVGDAVLFGRTMRVDFSLPPAIVSHGMTGDAATNIFIAEFSRLSDIAYILPFPSISSSSTQSLLSVFAKPLGVDPVAEVIQRKFVSDVTNMKFAMVKGPGPNEELLLGVITYPSGSTRRFTLPGDNKRPDEVIERMARQVASDLLPYRVGLSDYLAGVKGDREGFKSALKLAQEALAREFDAGGATQRALLYNLLGLLALHQNDLAAADAHWATGMQVPMATGTAYAILAVNRAMVALARKDPKQARAMYNTALASKARPYLNYFDAHLDIVDSLTTWAEGDRKAADAGLAQADKKLLTDAALTYRAAIATEEGRHADAKVFAEKATFLKTLKSIHPDLVGSVFWIDPTKGGLTLRQ